MSVDVRQHIPVLLSGLEWLYETHQSGEAVLQHHGEGLASTGNRSVSFTPLGWCGRVVIVVDVAHVEYASGRLGLPSNPLVAGELEAFAALLTDLGHSITKAWNGHPAVTGSLALARPAHPTMAAAVRRYLAGCLHHGGSVSCRCGWYADGYSRITGLRDVHTARSRRAATAMQGGGAA